MNFLNLIFFFLLTTSAFAESLTIGCATKCDGFFHYALKRVGNLHGVKVKVLDVSKEGPIVDWKKYDGVIYPGGADIDPEYYLGSIEPVLQEYTRSLSHLVNFSEEGKRRDPIEYKLLQDYFSSQFTTDMPILGVCRGMQMLAVSQGIPLYLDIKTELGIRNRRYLYDRIYNESGDSLMNELFSSSFKAFKRHHQGIRVPYFKENSSRWPHIKITSYSNRGQIAESLEFSNRPILGVQFHPENDFGFERYRIFTWLIKKALNRKITRANENRIE